MKHLSNYHKFFISLNEELGPPEDPKAQEGEEKPEQPKEKIEVPDWFKNDKAFFGISDKGDRATLGLDKSMIEPSWEMVKNLQEKIAKKEFKSVKELQEWLWTQKDLKIGENTLEANLNEIRKKITPPKGPLTLEKFADGKFGIGTYMFLAQVTKNYQKQLELSKPAIKLANINYSDPKQAVVQLQQVKQEIKQQGPKAADKELTDLSNAEEKKELQPIQGIDKDKNEYLTKIPVAHRFVTEMKISNDQIDLSDGGGIIKIGGFGTKRGLLARDEGSIQFVFRYQSPEYVGVNRFYNTPDFFYKVFPKTIKETQFAKEFTDKDPIANKLAQPVLDKVKAALNLNFTTPPVLFAKSNKKLLGYSFTVKDGGNIDFKKVISILDKY